MSLEKSLNEVKTKLKQCLVEKADLSLEYHEMGLENTALIEKKQKLVERLKEECDDLRLQVDNAHENLGKIQLQYSEAQIKLASFEKNKSELLQRMRFVLVLVVFLVQSDLQYNKNIASMAVQDASKARLDLTMVKGELDIAKEQLGQEKQRLIVFIFILKFLELQIY